MSFAISLSNLGYRLGDDTEIFSSLTATIPSTLVGLIGDNGVGKSTLVRIIASQIAASQGTVSGTVTGADGAVYIDQLLPHTDQSVAEALDIQHIRGALLRTLDGRAEADDFEIIGDNWDIEERALGALANLGLVIQSPDFDRRISSFSGGQAMRIGLARAALVGSNWLILDEPSNNLDEDGLRRLRTLLRERTGGTVVISHDRTLLDDMETIVEMTESLRVYGGNFTFYKEMVEAEEASKLQNLTDAMKTYRIEKRQRIELETTLARSEQKGAKDKKNKRRPPIAANAMHDAAQKSAAKRRGDKAADEAGARSSVQAAKDELRRDSSITVNLPETTIHASKRVLEVNLPVLDRPRQIVGPERVRLVGPNGAGKSTLLGALIGRPPSGAPVDELFPGLDVDLAVPVAYLDQQYRLPETLTVMEAVREHNPDLDPHRVHEVLAAMGLRAGRTDQQCSTLSGGERFRVALAAGLLSDPAPQLLVLDEPGNNLDLSSLHALVTALEGFGGAMIVVTHDEHLAADLGLHTEWEIREFLRPSDVDMMEDRDSVHESAVDNSEKTRTRTVKR